MPSRVVLVNPEAPAPAAAPGVAPRPAAGGTLRLGTLSNSKPNADLLLRLVTEHVRAAVDVSTVVARRKPHPAYPAGDAVLDELAKEADLVVTAMGD
jgi:hypothetical protein